MLNFMRQNANSWIMIVLFSIIIFVFAINFGPWAGSQSTEVPYAAIVNNQPISMAEFRAAYASQFARIKQYRPDYEQDQADRDGLKQMVLDQLIARELLYQLGKKNHILIGPKTLADEIKERVFGKDANFDKEEYTRRVNTYFQSSVAHFEQQVAKEVVAEQIVNLLGISAYIPDADVLAAYKERSTKVSVEFVKVNPKNIVITKVFGPDEIKKFHDENGKKVNDYYNEHLGEYVKEAKVRASHILVKVPNGAKPEEKAALKEKAEKILTRLKTEDFAVVAKAESDDPGSKEKGGDLDFFAPGNMVEEFSKAAFALKPGEISSLVETPYGFHIIKQTGHQDKVERKLEEVSTEIAELLLKRAEQEQKARALAESAQAQFKNGVALANLKGEGLVHAKSPGKSNPETTVAVADDTEAFNLSSPFIYKLGRADAINDAVSLLTLENPTADKVIEANGEYLAIRLKTREDADMAKFEEQKASIAMTLMFPRKRAFMQQYVDKLKSNAKIKYNDILMTTSPTA